MAICWYGESRECMPIQQCWQLTPCSAPLLQVTVDLIIDFFVKHAINYNLGQIATNWLVYADRKGAGCQECLDLAQLHSRAVDFPKTGERPGPSGAALHEALHMHV
jgi:hypothetical protein